MPVESLEERTVEVLSLPAAVDEELLFLYFENKRRSGGGQLVSVEKTGDRAVLVFEETEAAAQVLFKEHHVLHNVELSVRKPASKDRCRLLLRGIKPSTSSEMVELYVEIMMGLNVPDYTLCPSAGREFFLIHLSQPLSKDFQNLSAKISQRKLDGAVVTLEQIEQTDSLLVENLHPGTTADLLTLYFETKRGGDQKVKEVTMLAEGTAKVSFVKYESLGHILDLTHKLDGNDLVVKPYFDFLQPAESLTSQDSATGGRETPERNEEDIPMQTSPPVVVHENSQTLSQMSLKPLVVHAEEVEVAAEEVMDQMEEVSEREGNIDAFTLKGMESEKQTAIMGFLTTPIERETVIPMEPGMLKYIQIHRHQLMADMNQVSIFPLEAEDVCGLKIHGHATACQMAEEVLQDVVTSICTRVITVNAPGVTRFLEEADCQHILKEMDKKFQVYINLKAVPWQHLAHQDIFDTAWNMMSGRNFPKVSSDSSPQELRSDSMHLDQNGAPGNGLLEAAKKIVSAVDDKPEDPASNSNNPDEMDDVDLYSAAEPTSLTDQDLSGIAADSSQPSAVGNNPSGLLLQSEGAVGLSSDFEEDAQLSLAIQYSMETSHYSLEDEEEQLQKALELSKEMSQHESSPSCSEKSPVVKKSFDASLLDAIKAANTLQLFVFAGYPADLIRVDIAFGKKVTGRQVEEKLEHRCVRNMSDYHRICLDMIKRKHAVEIQIQGSIITVSGFKDYVAGGVCDVKLLLEKISTSVSEREILRSVQWVYHDPVSSDTTPYSPDATVFIETALRMRMQKVDILLDNQPHTINFEKMQEYNIASGKSVKISRKMPASGALDEDIPEEEYSLLSNLPEVSKVDEESDEFQNVVKNFYETIKEFHSKIRIIKVEKLMNRLLYNQYKLKKASVLQRATYPVIEQTLYHGTSENSVKEICVHGFNRSFCGKNATVYGQGVYFAVNSALSVQEQYSPPNADGHKYVFVSKVLTGDYTKGCHSMKTAPLKETEGIPLRYDSVTDDITKPEMFIIFNDTQAFPEYLITCQRITR
ncbi:hypothetical protein JOQ06_024736 [Pogonophryne albipinna]|uniref:Poly [ADP-ribose] polymerase n=1 Tax=Pogonophryne albipinna TaxID=1090488 RepID=A0AAD6A4N8_9TELE|nr:hypothetical protein JOQ06_024736 [Pogonophryne albipinna]